MAEDPKTKEHCHKKLPHLLPPLRNGDMWLTWGSEKMRCQLQRSGGSGERWNGGRLCRKGGFSCPVPPKLAEQCHCFPDPYWSDCNVKQAVHGGPISRQTTACLNTLIELRLQCTACWKGEVYKVHEVQVIHPNDRRVVTKEQVWKNRESSSKVQITRRCHRPMFTTNQIKWSDV